MDYQDKISLQTRAYKRDEDESAVLVNEGADGKGEFVGKVE